MQIRKIAVITSGLFLVTTALMATEKKIKKSDLPAAVQKTADEQSQGATVKGYNQEVENGNTYYEVELTVNGHSKDVSMDPDGKVVEIEEEIALTSLPDAVHKGLTDQAKGGKITRVESLTKGGKLVAYEAQVVTGKKRSEIQVGPDGNPLKHKE